MSLVQQFRDRHGRLSELQEMPAHIPPVAKHVYFRDVIGNVSTSAVRMTAQGVRAWLLPKFLLPGGFRCVSAQPLRLVKVIIKPV